MIPLPAKLIIAIMALFLVATANAARAAGACPIVVDQLLAMHAPAADASKTFADTLFGLRLAAPEAQSLSGHLVIQSNQDQYAVALPEVTLKTVPSPDDVTYAASEPLFITFDKPTSLTVVWLDDMKHGDKTSFCPPRPIFYDRTYLSAAEKNSVAQQLRFEERIRSTARSTQNTLKASFVGPLASLPCRSPNAEGTAFHVVAPDGGFARLRGRTSVMVRLGADGAVLETKIYKSSGSELLDNLSAQAARESWYTPRIQNCRPVSGDYLFVVEFR